LKYEVLTHKALVIFLKIRCFGWQGLDFSSC